MPDSLGLHGSWPARLLCPGNFPGKNRGWVAISYSRGSSWLRDWRYTSCISYTGRQTLYHCTTLYFSLKEARQNYQWPQNSMCSIKLKQVLIQRDFLGGTVVRNPPTKQETWVWSLGQEDSLEKAMAPHSRTLAWKIPWTEEPGGLQSTGSQESWTQLSD